ncbi:MAG: DUF1232 domain-containing protein [bacterium]
MLWDLISAVVIRYPLSAFKFVKNIPNFIKLYWCLLFDKRVPFYLKLMLFGAISYFISPIDFVPEVFLPLIGILDDVVVLILALRYFILWCPKELVMEHVQAIDQENKKNTKGS